MVVGIIGGGASGMAAAISAAKNQNVNVILFERQARLGRKLQATGNGRCNLSNINISFDRYHGNDSSFVVPALQKFDVTATLSWFRSMGLFTVAEDNGKIAVIIEDSEQSTIVTVSDNGGGVETQELSKIFNRFHRTKKAKPQSAGIGLAITKAIVEKHHGTISAENTEKGLNIIMCFPHLDGYITY